MGLLLLIVSLVLSVILYPIALLTSVFMSFRKSRFKDGLRKLNQQFMSVAVAIDAVGNVTCDDLLNLIWVRGHQFGNRKETISSVLGKNQITHTLTWFGWLIAGLLDMIQKDHCKKSIDNNILKLM